MQACGSFLFCNNENNNNNNENNNNESRACSAVVQGCLGFAPPDHQELLGESSVMKPRGALPLPIFFSTTVVILEVANVEVAIVVVVVVVEKPSQMATKYLHEAAVAALKAKVTHANCVSS